MAPEKPPMEPKTPDQEQYEDDVYESRWVELDDGDGHFEVRELPPLRLLRDMRQKGVEALLNGDEDEADIQSMIESGGLSDFIEDTLLPNVIQPNVYWSDIGDGDFDMATLTPNDLMTVIVGMTGQDKEDLQEKMDETFPGQPDSSAGPSGRE